MDCDFTEIKRIISNMGAGDKNAIILGLKHKGALIRINGIMNSVSHKCSESKIIESIKQLKEDSQIVDGYSVSQFAIAALHVLNIEQYCGEDEQILALIKSNFEF